MSETRSQPIVLRAPRLPMHPSFKQKYGIEDGAWRVLIDSIWPGARTLEAIDMALGYCKVRNLDPFKRPVHIVAVYSAAAGRMIEGMWPGIGELRTTAMRTGEFAGRDRTEYGPDITRKFSSQRFDDRGESTGADEFELTFCEWMAITVYRLDRTGQPRAVPGPRVYWLETYATENRRSEAPNSMWRKRPRGQLEKCAEAAALRAAFPEELGNQYAAEEIEGQVIDHEPDLRPIEADFGSDGVKERARNRESTTTEERAKAAESTIGAERAKRRERTISTERATAAESTNPVERAQPVESTKPVERAMAGDSTICGERATPAERTNPVERARIAESTTDGERANDRERTKGVERAITTESTTRDERAKDPLKVPMTHGAQAWFGPARAKLRELTERQAPPEEFRHFKDIHADELATLQREFRSWRSILDKILSEGLQGSLA